MVDAWRWLLAVLALTAAAWFTSTNTIEAYGAGPPYYSRTTNVDKWESPVGAIVAVDVVALVVVAVVLVPVRRRRGDQGKRGRS